MINEQLGGNVMRKDTNRYIKWLKDNMEKICKDTMFNGERHIYFINVGNYHMTFSRMYPYCESEVIEKILLEKDEWALHKEYKKVYRILKHYRLLGVLDKMIYDKAITFFA